MGGKKDSASGKPFKCSVEEKNSKTTQECQFPFKLNEKIFTNCTDFQDPDGRLWCSTKVSKTDRQHIGGGSYWGYCDIKDGKGPDCTIYFPLCISYNYYNWIFDYLSFLDKQI